MTGWSLVSYTLFIVFFSVVIKELIDKRLKKNMRIHYGDMIHVSNNGKEWVYKALIAYIRSYPQPYKCAGDSYYFCFEHELAKGRIPDGWTNPLLDKIEEGG